MSRRYRVVVAHVSRDAYSETFIRDHVRLLPLEVFEVFSSSFPHLERDGAMARWRDA